MLYFGPELAGESSLAPSLIHCTIFLYSMGCNAFAFLPLGISEDPSGLILI